MVPKEDLVHVVLDLWGSAINSQRLQSDSDILQLKNLIDQLHIPENLTIRSDTYSRASKLHEESEDQLIRQKLV